MRTSLLAPDGVWTEVTEHLALWGEEVDAYPWPAVLTSISDRSVGLQAIRRYSRRTLLPATDPGDRVILNLVWGATCATGVSTVTVLRIEHFDAHQPWLDAVTKWAGCTTDAPHPHWSERRAHWMLWAHYPTAAPSLETARILAGNHRAKPPTGEPAS